MEEYRGRRKNVGRRLGFSCEFDVVDVLASSVDLRRRRSSEKRLAGVCRTDFPVGSAVLILASSRRDFISNSSI